MSVIVGVDIAKSKFDYRIITEGNDKLSKGSCKMTSEGFQESKFDYRIITEGNDKLSKGSCKMTSEGF